MRLSNFAELICEIFLCLEQAVRSPRRVRKPVNGSVCSAEAASGARVLLLRRCCGMSGEPESCSCFCFLHISSAFAEILRRFWLQYKGVGVLVHLLAVKSCVLYTSGARFPKPNEVLKIILTIQGV